MQATTTMSKYTDARKTVVPVGVRAVTANDMAHLGEMARHSKGKMYIIRGYVEGMAGTKIPDERLVKPKIEGTPQNMIVQIGLVRVWTDGQHRDSVRPVWVADPQVCTARYAGSRIIIPNAHGQAINTHQQRSGLMRNGFCKCCRQLTQRQELIGFRRGHFQTGQLSLLKTI
jgi:hypothetical protein